MIHTSISFVMLTNGTQEASHAILSNLSTIHGDVAINVADCRVGDASTHPSHSLALVDPRCSTSRPAAAGSDCDRHMRAKTPSIRGSKKKIETPTYPSSNTTPPDLAADALL